MLCLEPHGCLPLTGRNSNRQPPYDTGFSMSAPQPLTPELKRALQAFKKRLKLTRLDEESGIGGRKTTGGLNSSVVAISPPDQYPKTVWDELVKAGRLKASSGGLYELVPM